MDLLRLREDFEGLTPEGQMEFMASVGPAFCRSVMADPARRRLMMTRFLGKGGCGCPMGRIPHLLVRAGITMAAVTAGVRAAAAHLARGSAAAPARE